MIKWIKRLFNPSQPTLSESARVMAKVRNSKPKKKKEDQLPF